MIASISITADKSHPASQPATGRLRPATQINFPRPVIAVLTYLAVRGKCYLVGGVVRDLLMQRSPADFDLATDLPPEQIRLAFPEAVEMDNLTRTFILHIEGIEIEITPLQNTGSARIEESLMHRDLTINAMALPVFFREGRLTLGTLLDPTGKGVSDVAAGRVRFNGNIRPENLIRACRFLATLGFEIDGEQKELMAQNSSLIAQAAPEIINRELLKILESDHPEAGLLLLRESGILKHLGISAKAADFERVARTARGVRLIVFLKELGFTSANVQGFLEKYRFGNEQIRKAKKLLGALEETQKNFDKMQSSPQTIREILAKLVDREVKEKYFEDYISAVKVYYSISERMELCLRQAMRAPLSIGELQIGGNDLTAMGISGREIGQRLHCLLSLVLADPNLNQREILLGILRNNNRESSG